MGFQVSARFSAGPVRARGRRHSVSALPSNGLRPRRLQLTRRPVSLARFLHSWPV